ncbi:hypothetical protein UPYG_G00270870 [Umbra pygmaea]|uniref:Uncharacterized protein n=1 Tax=Umbra pygmaea TaxID=75934 RepID=A0ABD0WBN8_UMBPY
MLGRTNLVYCSFETDSAVTLRSIGYRGNRLCVWVERCLRNTTLLHACLYRINRVSLSQSQETLMDVRDRRTDAEVGLLVTRAWPVPNHLASQNTDHMVGKQMSLPSPSGPCQNQTK